MTVLENFPIKLNPKTVIKEHRFNKKRGSSVDILKLLKEAQSLIRTQAYYEVSYITKKEENSVEIDGVTFSSRVLRINLEKIERVFPYIITIGKDLEDKASSYDDILMQYYLEYIGDMVLHSCRQCLIGHIKRRYGLDKLASMSPGSLKNWPITEQKPLFSLFRKKQHPIGVKLTDSMLMLPRKSISGILFPTEVTFFSCQLCPRKHCPARKVPYDENLKKKYQLIDD